MKNKIFWSLILASLLSIMMGFSSCEVDVEASTPEYTVTYKTKYGECPAEIKVSSGTILTETQLPTLHIDSESIVFDGWFDSKGKKVIAGKYEVKQNVTLTAKWYTKTYTITFDSNGGSYIKPITIEHGQCLTGWEIPFKDGFTFDNWYSDSSFNTPIDWREQIKSDKTFYAKWTTSVYTVNFVTNCKSEISTQYVEHNTTIKEPEAPENIGHIFQGWFTDERCTKPFNFSTPIKYSLTLYASWSIRSCTVTFENNDGGCISEQTVVYGETSIIPSYTLTRTGYTFTGWFSDKDCTEQFDFSSPITGTTYIYAGWKINSYTITFVSNGGTEISPIIANYDTRITMPTAPEYTGHTFTGWYTDEECTKKFYENTGITQDYTLYAGWKYIYYSVYFYGNTRDHNYQDYTRQIVLYGKNVEIPELPNDYYPGHTLTKWYKDEACTEPFDFSTPITENTYVYAGWKLNTYTITFETNGGSTIESQSIGYGNEVEEPSTPTKEGYTFSGWFEDINCTREWNFYRLIYEKTTIYAGWNLNCYEVNFESNSGTYVSTQYVHFGYTAQKPTSSKTGFSLENWYIDKELSKEFDFSTPITEPLTLYAKWIDIVPPAEASDIVCNYNKDTNILNLTWTDPVFDEETSTPFDHILISYSPEENETNPTTLLVKKDTQQATIENFSTSSDFYKLSLISVEESGNTTDVPMKISTKNTNIHVSSSIAGDVIKNLTTSMEIHVIGNLDYANFGTIPSALNELAEEILIDLDLSETKNNLSSIKGFENCQNLSGIVIPNGVTKISRRAFYNCINLTKVTIPDSVTTIEDAEHDWIGAFEDCRKLSNITLSKNLTHIGNNAFCNCSSLESINIPEGVTEISGFSNCTSLKSINIPESVTKIGSFSGCSSLKSINIPEGVTEIGSFSGCSSLETINLPDGVTKIGRRAFEECSSLESINLPDSVTEIEQLAFCNCTSLKNITIPSKISKIPEMAFHHCTNLTNVNILGEITTIEQLSFYDCTNLTTITAEKNFTSTIEQSAFENCSKLTSIPFSVSNTESQAFYHCENLSEVTISNDATTIGNRAFCSCHNLKITSIPDNITIGEQAFGGCKYLKNIEITDNMTITETSFSGCTIETLKTPFSKFKFIPNNCSITNLIITEGEIPSEGFKDYSKIQKITLPETITTIESKTFSGCTSLTNINFPQTITSIGEYAFENCSSLESFSIPNTVTSIGASAFRLCKSLKTFKIPNKITVIESYTFSGCTNLESITIPTSVSSIESWAFSGCSSLDDIIIPEGVTTLKKEIFYGCSSLTTISLPNTITSIESMVFYNCTELTITIPKRVKTIVCNAFYNSNNNIYFEVNADWYYKKSDGSSTYIGSLYKDNVEVNSSLIKKYMSNTIYKK